MKNWYYYLHYFSLCILYFVVINTLLPTYYMDEYFHVNQVKQYYINHDYFSWDPMITTFPGLYFISLPIAYIINFILPNILNLTLLFRLCNMIFLILIPSILYKILKLKYIKIYDLTLIKMKALELSTFPIMFFFHFLYYTDSISLYFTLLMYYYTLQNKNHVVSLIGILCIFIRQTNIIWFGFYIFIIYI